MAAKGSSKRAVKQSLNFKKLACDVLSFTACTCGVPDHKLKTTLDVRNSYSIDNLIDIFSAVLSVAFSSRDTWKRMFESRLRSSDLDTKEKIQEYLSIMVKFRRFKSDDPSDQIFISLALYSEMMCFLDYKQIEFDFEHLLDTWDSYVTETVLPGKNADELFKTLLYGNPDVKDYLNLMRRFIIECALPYGQTENISAKFDEFSQVLEEYSKSKTSIADSVEQRIVDRLGFMPHNPLPENVEESVSLLSSILDRDTDLPGNRESSPEEPRSPSVRDPEIQELLASLNITSQSPRQESSPKPRGKGKGKKRRG